MKSIFCFVVAIFSLVACKKEPGIGPIEGNFRVRYLDFEQSCDWNLELIDHKLNRDNSPNIQSETRLYGNVDDFNIPQLYQFGDTFSIEFEVLTDRDCPYIKRLITCNAWHGTPIKIISVE